MQSSKTSFGSVYLRCSQPAMNYCLSGSSIANTGPFQSSTNQNPFIGDALLHALSKCGPNTRVFQALFQYIPLRDSPNENPHLELALQPGDYILVHGPMDEDQFYFGETLNGDKSGLVPSNYIQRVPEYTLLQNISRSTSHSYLPTNSQSNTISVSNPFLNHQNLLQNSALKLSSNLEGSCHQNINTQSSTVIGSCYNSLTRNQQETTQDSPSFTVNVPPHHTKITHDFTDHDKCITAPLTSASNTLTKAFSASGYRNILQNDNYNSINDDLQLSSGTYTVPSLEQQLAANISASLTNLSLGGNPSAYSTLSRQIISTADVPFPDSVCPYPPLDVSKVTVQEIKQPNQPRVPFPREITVEKRMAKSVLISWLPPEDSSTIVSHYHVCVDGTVKAVVPGSYKCKALLEDINLEKSVNISVRAITENNHSPDAACSIAIGNDASVAPQHLRVWNVTPVGACVSWYPSNSNAEHVLLLNGSKVGVCPSSVFQVQLHGLIPSTIYRVSVRTKHPKAVLEQRPVERCLDFKTLPKIGLPDPPSNVQLELGPQAGSLLLSWTPVTSQPKPPSRAAVYSYLIYGDGKNIAQVPSAEADHILLNIGDLLEDLPLFLTVRTKTKEGAVSADSNVVRVPRNINTLTQTQRHLFNSGKNLSGSLQYLDSRIPGTFLLGGQITSGDNLNIGIGNSLQQPPTIDTAIINQGTSFQQHQQQQQQQQQTKQQGIISGILTTTSLPNSLIYQQPQKQQSSNIIQYPQSSVSFLPQGGRMPNIGQGTSISQHPVSLVTAGRSQSSGLLTTIPSNINQLNGGIQGTSINCYQNQPSFQQPSTSYYYPNSSITRSRPSHLLQHQNTAPLNYITNTLNKNQENESVFQHEYPSTSSQYYTFHPNGLYKEYNVADEKPSILEMENNYLLKHRNISSVPYNNRYYYPENIRNTHDYYPRNDKNFYPYTSNVSHGTGTYYTGGYGTMERRGMVGGHLTDRLSRVRSEEILGPGNGTTRSEPDLRPVVFPGNPIEEEDHFIKNTTNDRTCRWFVALFDYDVSMSPNPNAAVEELPFKKHQLIKVYGDADPDGFYHGQIGRRCGLVPGNMVIEIAKNDIINEGSRGVAVLPDPNIRRMRWGSLKSRSYDNSGDRRRGPGSVPPPMSSRGITTRNDEYPLSLDMSYELPSGVRRIGPGDEISPRMRYYDGKGPMVDDYNFGSGRQISVGRHASYGGRDWSLDGRRNDMFDRQHRQPEYPSTRRGRPSYGYDNYEYDQHDKSLGSSSMYPKMNRRIIGYDEKGHSIDDRGPTSRNIPGFSSGSIKMQKMVAKFDYDSRQLSPNVDAEQVELSFKQGDIITIYGDMDEDGFYMGELNGIRGLVPSNFLAEHTPNTLLPPNIGQQHLLQRQSTLDNVSQQQIKVKGVAFSEGPSDGTMMEKNLNSDRPPVGNSGMKKVIPGKQANQGIGNKSIPIPTNGNTKSTKIGTATSTKGTTKKAIEVPKSGVSGSSGGRKISQSTKKVDTTIKKK
ncbi:SH3 domain and Fibronectin, type III domain and Variant SH3 domain and Immunoglobulin-like fold domain-containing protein [Strongyloides ratti]|uniref:SH3 domain and Fibronectin, type III domain and Variant SH3 domain and Immunoglobulin-like fold domain-containing protein n=1 Tax=Strongyloides ratti TaxID=34506 RepID=A0A090LDZ1_STRRB|nr:SH3 domain and Fibronectin, type III domain and Variant SH3 domain and Immunoglobulin-like fold domain-containing protein [Strongyloides ratti]CEF67982.1 SH3 domain and Fibronectin, type III domain and Variant SH3 domain and Immunoglobulin-like fold domain-containing protein [Strongyloides ratti]